jgi:hypothetical protein
MGGTDFIDSCARLSRYSYEQKYQEVSTTIIYYNNDVLGMMMEKKRS